MTESNYDKLLDASLDELPREIKPPRDLWAGIDHAIEMRESEKKAHVYNFRQIAATLALIVGGAWFLYSGTNVHPNSSNEVSLTMLAQDIDKGFKVQKANILAVYEGQTALTLTWRDQLRELEVARNSVWTELQKNPNNAYMIQILLDIQQQQLDLIKNVHTRLNQDI
jgi:hypothetical protein